MTSRRERTDSAACRSQAFRAICGIGHAPRGRNTTAGEAADGRQASHPSAKTVTGLTISAESESAVETPGQEVIAPLDKPLKATGGLGDS